jgi:TP53 regulating kinase-like protein
MEATLLKQGAEAKIFVMPPGNVLAKQRFSKSYRIPALDAKLTKERVVQEARMLVRLGKLEGISTPCLYLVDMETATLYMEYLECPSVRDWLEMDLEGQKKSLTSLDNFRNEAWIAKKLGEGLARIHDLDVVHGSLHSSYLGDLTTSNLLLDGDRLVWIDFGLSFVSALPEDKGRKLNL